MIDPTAILKVISDLQLRNAQLEDMARAQSAEIEALKAASAEPTLAEKRNAVPGNSVSGNEED